MTSKESEKIEDVLVNIDVFKYTITKYLSSDSLKDRAAMRRASMDLTRDLAELRKQKYYL
jgi:hypothetical protein